MPRRSRVRETVRRAQNAHSTNRHIRHEFERFHSDRRIHHPMKKLFLVMAPHGRRKRAVCVCGRAGGRECMCVFIRRRIPLNVHNVAFGAVVRYFGASRVSISLHSVWFSTSPPFQDPKTFPKSKNKKRRRVKTCCRGNACQRRGAARYIHMPSSGCCFACSCERAGR